MAICGPCQGTKEGEVDLQRGEAAWGQGRKSLPWQSYLDKISEVQEGFANWRATGVAWKHPQARSSPIRGWRHEPKQEVSPEEVRGSLVRAGPKSRVHIRPLCFKT